MAERQMIVVVYDISVDKRRTKLHKRLKDFGAPVQYSVFECLLTPQEFDKMKAAVNRVIRPRVDHVRYYPVCAACRKKIEVTGRKEVTVEPEVLVV